MDLEEFINQNLNPPAKILDLGAGDFSEINKLKGLGYDTEGVDLKTGTNLNQTYLSKNTPFDLVYSSFVLHYLNNKKTLIETAYNNLKPNGFFFLQDIKHDQFTNKMYMDMKETKKLIEDGGFEVINSDIIDFYDDKPDHQHWHKIIRIWARR